VRHDEHRDVLRSVPVSVTTSAAALALAASTLSASCAALAAAALAVSASALSVSASAAECDTTASAGGSECDTASSSTCCAECDSVSASSTAARESVTSDIAFRLVLDASPDGLPVFVGQRLPRCEQQRVLPSGRVEPRLLWREQPERAHVCGLLDASNN